MAKIPGIKIGHAQNDAAMTGCTVILCEDGAVAGFDLRGSAPGTRETELLRPGFLVEKINGVLLTGGSAFGLDAAAGVVNFLEERQKGYNAGGFYVPIVPAAVIFDLHSGDGTIRPDKKMGYQACENATDRSIDCGSVGVGSGATVGKIAGNEFAMAGGLGYAVETLLNGLIISAVVVVNSLGDVIDPGTGEIVAGAVSPAGEFLDSVAVMKKMQSQSPLKQQNTTLAVVMTNGSLNKVQVNKVAQMAQNGLARTIRPVHTMYDGDLVFALSSGDKPVDVNVAGEVAAECVSQAILSAVTIGNQKERVKLSKSF